MSARSLSILGSTGSVGCATLDVATHLRATGQEDMHIVALTAARNVDLLAAQAKKHNAAFAAIADPSLGPALAELLSGTGIRTGAGPQAIIDAAAMDASCVMAAIVGSAGLAPALAAVRRGATLALANKECLVSAGAFFMEEVRRCRATLIPVDSEHSAIFQLFDSSWPEAVERIVLTASGGPFRTMPQERMAKVTPAQAVAHPTWSMGQKISVDSATLMNKGLELIEAHHLFGIGGDRLDVLIHPQSLVHAFVVWRDGSVLMHAGAPDMRTPIAVALGWPRRVDSPARRLDLTSLAGLSFEQPDIERFPALRLARQALQAGRGAPTILNAANEVAVAAFLEHAIGFLAIAGTVGDCLAAMGERRAPASLEEAVALDEEARRTAQGFVRAAVAAQ